MALSSRTYGLLAVFSATVALSTAGLMTRLVSIDAPTLTFLRGLIGGLFLFACLLAMYRGRFLDEFRHLGRSGMIISLVSATCMILFINALYITSVAHVSIIFALCPFMAAGLAFLMLGERPRPVALAASGIALVGIALMMNGGSEGRLAGDLLALVMTGMMALWTVLVRRHQQTPALASTVVSTLIAAVMIAPFANPFAASSHDLAVIFVFGVFGFSIGFMLLLIGSRLLSPVESVLIGSLEAPLAPLWVFLFVGEAPDAHALAGGAVVFAAVCLNVFSGRRPAMQAAGQSCVD